MKGLKGNQILKKGIFEVYVTKFILCLDKALSCWRKDCSKSYVNS